MDRSWQENAAYGEDGSGAAGFRSGSVRPEILPPDEQRGKRLVSASRQYQTHRLRPRRPTDKSASPGRALRRPTRLSAINSLVFVGMVLTGVSFISPTARQLVSGARIMARWCFSMENGGGLSPPCSSMLASSTSPPTCGACGTSACSPSLCMGPMGVFSAYILTGFAGNLLSIANNPGVAGHPSIVGAGASGAVFGLAGVLIVLLKSPCFRSRSPSSSGCAGV